MTAPNKMAKRAAAGTLALAVCFTGGLVAASSASAAAGFKFDQRFGGADRFETAAIASKAAFESAGDVIIVQDDALADGLTASYLAGVKKAPILYVKRDSVPDATAKELDRLKAERITIVGGLQVVSDSVKDKLSGNGRTVTRIGGSDRFDTAAQVATSNGNDVGTVFIANGDAPADALAAGPIAYKSGNPILLTRSADVPSSTSAALDKLNETNRIVLGGNTVVSATTYTDLGGTNRLGGENRQATAVLIADYATANEGFTKANAALVGPEDRNTADALIAAPLAGQAGTPILFTARGGLGTETTKYLQENAGALTGKGYVFGGDVAVPTSVSDAASTAAQGDPTKPVPTLKVTTESSSVQTVSTATGENANRGAVSYAVDVPADVKSVNIALYSTDDLVTTDGATKFKSSTAISSGSVVIESVNGGVAGAGTYKATAAPVNGRVMFTVDSTGEGKVTPVVFVDKTGGAANTLDFDPAPSATTPQAPTEVFAVGQNVQYIPAVSQGGTFATAMVSFVDKATNTFSVEAAGGGQVAQTFTYDANDNFIVAGGGSTIPRDSQYFEDRLTIGDSVSGTYAPSEAQSSSFTLTNSVPGIPSGIAKVSATTSSILVTVGNIDATKNPTVRIYGALDATDSNATDDVTGDNAPLLATVTKDASTAAGFQVSITGLTANKPYDLYATQEIGGEESSKSTKENNVTTAAAAALVANGSAYVDTGATNGAADTKLNSGDRIDLSFTGPVTVGSTYSVNLLDDEGRERTLTQANSTAQVVGTDNNVLRLTVGAAGPDIGAGIGEFDVTAFQIAATTGLSNSTGSFNLVGSGEVRSLKGANPPALTAANVALGAGADTIEVTGGLTATSQYTLDVYSADGTLLGSADVTAGAGGVVAPTAVNADLTTTTNYYVTYRLKSGDTRISIATTKAAV